MLFIDWAVLAFVHAVDGGGARSILHVAIDRLVDWVALGIGCDYAFAWAAMGVDGWEC